MLSILLYLVLFEWSALVASKCYPLPNHLVLCNIMALGETSFVNITAKNNPLFVGEVLELYCISSNVSVDIELVIDGHVENGEKYHRIISNKTGPGHMTYQFTNVSIEDEGRQFQCITKDQVSSNISLIVYCK